VRRLTPFQRMEGKTPLGLLIEGSFDETVEKLMKLIEKEKPSIIISVGDVVSESLIKKDVFPDVFIVDHKVMRKSIAPFSAKVDETRYVKNPAGTLTEEALNELKEVLKKKSGKRVKIVVDGEEDLLTLPAVLYAPENSLVVYGQPRTGIVAVKVMRQTRERVRKVIEEMEHAQ